MANWNVEFSVDFTENGDKTRNAIQKHINELSKVYGHLNELKNTKVNTTDIQNNLTSTRIDAPLSAAMGKALDAAKEPRIPRGKSNVYIYVSPEGNDTTGDGSQAKPYKTILKTIAEIPDISMFSYYFIRLAAGLYECPGRIDVCKICNHIVFETASGEKDVDIRLTQVAYDGLLFFRACLGGIYFRNITFSIADGVAQDRGFIGAWKCSGLYLSFEGCSFRGNQAHLLRSHGALNFSQGCLGSVNSSTLSDFDIGIYCGKSVVTASHLAGDRVKIGLKAETGAIYKVGPQIVGTVANEQKINGGQIFV